MDANAIDICQTLEATRNVISVNDALTFNVVASKRRVKFPRHNPNKLLHC